MQLIFSSAWGIVLITTPACHNFGGIAVNRFLLGALEAAVNPGTHARPPSAPTSPLQCRRETNDLRLGFVLMMGMWYTSAEQPLRLEAYYCTANFPFPHHHRSKVDPQASQIKAC